VAIQQHKDRPDQRRLRVVALVGVDGSGKTTQAHRLTRRLTEAGVPAGYRRNAGGRRWLGRLANRLGRPDARSLLGPAGLLLIESVLRWLSIALALLGARRGDRVLVMDRYAVCQYASIRAHGGTRWEPLARWFYRIFPPPDVTFLLSVRPTEAQRRVDARGTDREELSYLVAADAAYRSLPEYRDFVVVDANRSPDEVARDIERYLRARPDDPGRTAPPTARVGAATGPRASGRFRST
jgi:dTMP kinase